MAQHIHVSEHPLVKTRVTELRNRHTPSSRFREVVRDLSVLLLADATTDLEIERIHCETPLMRTIGFAARQRIGFLPIMRAGIAMCEAMLSVFPDARVQHLGVYRDEKTLQPVQYYSKLPASLPVDRWFVLDPMLATGGSAVAAVQALKARKADNITFIGLIAAPEGVAALSEAHPDVAIYVAALDTELNGDGYILPGLGDAGDRLYGT